MECRDVREVADSFVAGELLPGTAREILHHLGTCRTCSDDLRTRQALRESIRQAFLGSRDLEAQPAFIARLRTRLEAADRKSSPRRAIKFRGWWAMAAAALLIVASGLAYRGRDWLTATSALARAAVRDHRDCALERRLAGTSISLEQATARDGDATYGILAKLPSDVETTLGVAHVLRRHVCIDAGRRFAHIIFEYRGQIVSLLVTADDQSSALTAPGQGRPHLTSERVVDGMPVVSFRASRYAVFFTGNVAEADLAVLAAVVAGPLYREVAGA
jgi:anti-sigma factor RsiW